MKPGKKRKLPPAFEDTIQKDLSKWRDNELLNRFYGGTSIIAGSTLLGDDVIEKLATCGERVETREEFAQHVRWSLGFDGNTTTEYGSMLLDRLRRVYSKFDEDATADEAHLKHLRSLPVVVDTGSFYAGSSNEMRRWTNLTAETYLQHNTGSTGNVVGETEVGQSTRARGRGRGRATHRGRGRRAS